jgi:hypothetical protein
MLNSNKDFVLGGKFWAASSNSRNPRMYRQSSSFLGLRTHHLVIALIASLIAVALVSNYYLW